MAQAADSAAPLFVYFGNFGARNKVDHVLARMDPRLNGIAPLASFGRFSRAVPEMVMWVRNYSGYADATIEQALGPAARRVERLAATTLDHTVFLNRGTRFEAVPLPLEAQFAPAFYAGVADFDGDGHEDLFLGQNFFATEIGTPRYDAGRGLLLGERRASRQRILLRRVQREWGGREGGYDHDLLRPRGDRRTVCRAGGAW